MNANPTQPAIDTSPAVATGGPPYADTDPRNGGSRQGSVAKPEAPPSVAASDVFSRLERRGAAQDGIDLLKGMILKGQLVAHQQLPSERELAELLGISRPTLREAIRALIALNILDSRHGEGTFVASLEPESLAEPIDFVLQLNMRHLADLTEIRLILEPAMSALAATRISAEQLARLETIVSTKAVHDDVVPVDLERSNDLDFDFHRALAQATGNPIAVTMLAAMSSLSRASRQATSLLIYHEQRKPETDDLRAILEAVRSGDGQAASDAMRRHIERVAAIFERIDREDHAPDDDNATASSD